jgi:phosphatidylglycerol:prolipoprotein diacylglycerol transferase
VYPTFLRIGNFEITSFGVLVAIGALVGLWIFGRELARSGLPEDATNAAVAGVIGGLIGAKLLWTIEHHGEDQLLSLLLSRGGMSWFGGFAGGIGAGLAVIRLQRLSIVRVLAAATPALAIGQAIGRIGCFLVGDDYGRPTDLPWGVAFPRGLPPTTLRVHPTQLYECAALIVVFVLLRRWRREGVPDARVLGRYLVLAGAVRFAIEFVRVNVRVLGPFTVAGLASLAITIVGVLILVSTRKQKRTRARVAGA